MLYYFFTLGKKVSKYFVFISRGKAGKNANFEALPEDWRERLLKKKRKLQSS